MRCARWGGSGIGLGELELGPPAPGWLRLQVLACGICGSDLHAWHRQCAVDPAGIPGHEIAGVLAEGAGAPRLAGDAAGAELFAIEPRSWCGRCARCRGGLRHLCEYGLLLGVSAPGGMADVLDVPRESLHPVPRGVGPQLASLAEPLAVALRGVGRAQLAPDSRALVLGGGTLGLLCGLLVRERAARMGERAARVGIAVRHAAQAHAARQLGLEPLQPSQLEPWAREVQPSAVFESVGGEADTLAEAVRLCAAGGTVVVLGLFAGYRALDARSLLLKELRLIASNTYAVTSDGGSEFGAAVAYLPRLAAPLTVLQTHQFPLARIVDAFECAADKRSGAIKVTVLPG